MISKTFNREQYLNYEDLNEIEETIYDVTEEFKEIVDIPTFNKKESIAFMEEFVAKLGFKSVKIMSPEAHDEIISFTSQLPHALAVALINSDNEKYDTGKYIGDSYRDLTRIANINESLWSELFLKNRDNLLNSIDSFEVQLDLIKQALLDEDESLLKQLFIKSSKRREKL